MDSTSKSVWLLYWNYNQERYWTHLGKSRIVAVLDRRVHSGTVKKHMKILYETAFHASVYELVKSTRHAFVGLFRRLPSSFQAASK